MRRELPNNDIVSITAYTSSNTLTELCVDR